MVVVIDKETDGLILIFSTRLLYLQFQMKWDGSDVEGFRLKRSGRGQPKMLVNSWDAPVDGFGLVLLHVIQCIFQGLNFVTEFLDDVPVVLFFGGWQRGSRSGKSCFRCDRGTGIHHSPLSQGSHCLFECLEGPGALATVLLFAGI